MPSGNGIGNILRKGAITERFFRIARIIHPHEVVPVAGEAVAKRALLAKAEVGLIGVTPRASRNLAPFYNGIAARQLFDAVATKREGHRSLRSDLEGQHRRWDRGLAPEPKQ